RAAAGEPAHGRLAPPLRQEGPRDHPQSESGRVDAADDPRPGRVEQTAEEDPPRAGPRPHHLHSERWLRLQDRAPLALVAARGEAPPLVAPRSRAYARSGTINRTEGENDGHLRD